MFVIHSLSFDPAPLQAKEYLILKGKRRWYIAAMWNHVGVRILDLLLPSVAGLQQEFHLCSN